MTWPYAFTDFALQQSTALGTADWQSVTNAPVQVGGGWQATVTQPAGNRFYRLSK